MLWCKKRENLLCIDENAKFFVSWIEFCLFQSRWTWTNEAGVLGADRSIYTSFLLRMFWNREFAIDQTFVRRAKQLIIYRIIVSKESGPNQHWTTILVNFWEGVLNQTIQPTQARMLGKITRTGRCKWERFPLSYSG